MNEGRDGWGFLLILVLSLMACGTEEEVDASVSMVNVGFGEGTIVAAPGATASIDGTVFDITQAVVQTEVSPGITVATQIKPGQHVEVDFKVDRVADVVHVAPQVVGGVCGLAPGFFRVLEQDVTTNTDPSVGPVTIFDGYTGIDEVSLEDAVAVHGFSRRDASGTYKFQATRVERLSTKDLPSQLTGVVTGLSVRGDVTRFKIGNMQVVVSSNTTILADEARLENGQTVTVFSKLSFVGLEDELNADFVRVKKRKNNGIDAYFGGTLTQVAGSANRFELNGVSVRFPDIVTNSFQLADLQYLQLRGNFASDGSLDVTGVSLRGSSGLDTEVAIRGIITALDFDSYKALVNGFQVRMGRAVTENCDRMKVGTDVAVRGLAVTDGILASQVKCFN